MSHYIDPDYYEFFGEQRERTYYDWGLRAYVRATVQAPKTPRDKVQPLVERDEEGKAPPRRPAMPRHFASQLAQQCADLLKERPMTAHDLADALNWSRNAVSKFFYTGPVGFRRLGNTSTGATLWGLEGVDYGTVYVGAMAKVVAYLQQVGSATASEICDGANITINTFIAARKAYPDALCCVETRKIGRTLAMVWGLTEGNDHATH